ncbi:cytochrome P450 [Nocardia amamiensis]|uniref:cytochrome P450 n=1 Tax=Nocardia amamiensis TaxID=404578 RepID=UPI000829E83E|nr:cytochrome P450 [Nocardia amamiensis]
MTTTTATTAPDVALEAIQRWVAAAEDVIPIIDGRNVLIRHPDDIRTVLTSSDFTKETGPNRYFRDHVADGVLTAPPHRHRSERLTLNAATRDYMELNRVAIEHADALAADLEQRGLRGESVDLAAAMSRLTLGVIAEVMMGWTVIDELAEVMAAAMAVLDASGAMLPGLDQLGPVRAAVFEVVEKMIARQPVEERGPALTAMVAAGFKQDAIVHQVVTLLLAGHETTANSLTWTWISLMRNPGVYRRWQQQMAENPRFARALTSPISREGLRLFPSSWIIGRRATVATAFGGVEVPAGCTITICPYITHRLPEFWPNPEVFDPARHEQPAGHRFAWIPFGAGRRMCLGSTYATWEADVVLSRLGQKMTFHSESAVSATPRFRFTLGAPSVVVDIEPIGERR